MRQNLKDSTVVAPFRGVVTERFQDEGVYLSNRFSGMGNSAVLELQEIQIVVADNGNGIDKNQQEKVFDKFYRVPKGNTHDVKGFGIGLYYTKKIVEKHEGSITLSSNKQQTIFTVNLPHES